MTRGAGAPWQQPDPGREAGSGPCSESPAPAASPSRPTHGLESSRPARELESGVAAHYVANDVYDDVDRLRGLPVRLDCGRQDPFYEADKAFVEVLPESPSGGFDPGGHNDDYWSRIAPAEIDWIGARFAALSTGGTA